LTPYAAELKAPHGGITPVLCACVNYGFAANECSYGSGSDRYVRSGTAKQRHASCKAASLMPQPTAAAKQRENPVEGKPETFDFLCVTP
jgi:hypothetical protein